MISVQRVPVQMKLILRPALEQAYESMLSIARTLERRLKLKTCVTPPFVERSQAVAVGAVLRAAAEVALLHQKVLNSQKPKVLLNVKKTPIVVNLTRALRTSV